MTEHESHTESQTIRRESQNKIMQNHTQYIHYKLKHSYNQQANKPMVG